MKINERWELQQVLDCNFLIDLAFENSEMIQLNETSVDVWKGVQQGMTEEQIAERMASEYDVSQEKALEDIRSFCRMMLEKGFFLP